MDDKLTFYKYQNKERDYNNGYYVDNGTGIFGSAWCFLIPYDEWKKNKHQKCSVAVSTKHIVKDGRKLKKFTEQDLIALLLRGE